MVRFGMRERVDRVTQNCAAFPTATNGRPLTDGALGREVRLTASITQRYWLMMCCFTTAPLRLTIVWHSSTLSAMAYAALHTCDHDKSSCHITASLIDTPNVSHPVSANLAQHCWQQHAYVRGTRSRSPMLLHVSNQCKPAHKQKHMSMTTPLACLPLACLPLVCLQPLPWACLQPWPCLP